MKWLERLLAVAAKEVLQLARDRITIGLIVGIPTIQLLLFGYAINFDVRNVSTARARPVAARRFRAAWSATSAQPRCSGRSARPAPTGSFAS